ncbi:MAG: mechanosensitive ion channel [Sedimentisphaerales bacterium]|nr:mechanosensitive ion channel [Sedimentisphaerales bacterium]
MKKLKELVFIFALTIVLFFSSFSLAQEADSDYTAVTANEPNVHIEELKLLLKPLTKDELIVEADAWLNLVKSKIQEIGNIEIQILNHPKDTEDQESTELKKQMVVTSTKLQEEKTGLIDRFNVVLDALKLKGGGIDDYKTYIAAVSGIDMSMEDIKDVNALKIRTVEWLKSPQGGMRWLKSIISFVVILVISCILACFVGKVTNRAVNKSKKFSDLLKQFFVSVASKTVFVVGFIMALSMLGIDIAPLIAGLGVAGFVIGFALQGTLSNFASGLMILMYRPYDVGNVIEAAGVVGVVDKMNLVSTTIKTFDNQIIVVPNGSIWGGVIKNITGSDTRRVDMKFGISYSDDIAKAEKILKEIVSSHQLVLKEPEPVVKMHELGESSVNFVCRPWSKTSDYWNVYWDVTRAVKERFDKEGVSIPFPQQDVHLYQTGD